MSDEIVDLRDGFRIEVVPCLLPKDEWAATLHRRRYTPGERTTYKKVGPNVLAKTPEAAAGDLLRAVNEGLLPGVELVG